MRFLDIDLDAFLNGIAHYAKPNTRLGDHEFKPWSEATVRAFMEKQCGLSTSAPLPGVFIKNHDEAFEYWQKLTFDNGHQLSVVHVDAHADLGMGDHSWVQLHSEQLLQPISARQSPPKGPGGLNPGSYLSYAVAAGWIVELLYVHPDEGGDDLPQLLFKDFDETSGFLQLKGYPKETLDRLKYFEIDFDGLRSEPALVVDSPVRFKKISMSQFMADAPFEHALLCHSPEYTPPASDGLIKVIAEYIQFKPY